MTWNDILNRLKSPVVAIQIFTIVVAVIVAFSPEATDAAKIIVGAVTAIYNVFAGMNNPTNKGGF